MQDDLMMEPVNARWIATVGYKTDNGTADVEFCIEEIEELHDLIERGPDWNTIEGIAIILNPRRRKYNATVEQTREM